MTDHQRESTLLKSFAESSPSPDSPSCTWTKEEDKLFERLLVEHTDQCPTRYESIASRLPGKSAHQVLKHHAALVADVQAIECDRVPMRDYKDDDVGPVENNNNESNEAAPPPEVVVERPPKKNKRDPECKWSEKEHMLFLKGLKEMGKGDWRAISRHYVMTRTATQVASHAQKYFKRQSEQGRKKRKSIHDITIDDLPATEQPNMNSLVPVQMQHNDNVKCQMQQQVNPSVSNPQHAQLSSSLQHPEHTPGRQQQQHQQSANHAGNWQEQDEHHQQQLDLLKFDWADTDNGQWQERKQQQQADLQLQQQLNEQQISQMVADLQNADCITPQERQPIQHDQQEQTIEVSQGLGAQGGHMTQQNDQHKPTEVAQGQDVPEEHVIQQNPKGDDDRLIPNMMLTEVNRD